MTWPADAWFAQGHDLLTRRAVEALPAEGPGALPAWFRESAEQVGMQSRMPDAQRERSLGILRGAEHAEHFIDLELLQNRDLPATRPEYVAMLQELGEDPHVVGFAPYAVQEWTGRLTLAFAMHRREPDNPIYRAQAIIAAGHLAHYAQDLCQPLHTTIHYDGRVGEDGESPGTGIHFRVDALVQKLEPEAIEPPPLGQLLLEMSGSDPDDLLRQLTAHYTLTATRAAHQLVDRTYELEPHLPPVEQQAIDSDQVAAFAVERASTAAGLTAQLISSAWVFSRTTDLPPWLFEDIGAPTHMH
jgi:hypothetical protein